MISVAARVFRGEAVEAIHYASVAVVGGDGTVSHYLGDPKMAVMTRSSVKPFQVLPMLLSGAADKYSFDLKQLAIMCGSHSGTDQHRQVVLCNLTAAGNGPQHLRCGCHVPLFMQDSGVLPRNEEELDPVRHNCSGKHSGFMAQARFLGDDIGDYIDPESRTQRLVREMISQFCEYETELMPSGVDGCSAPNVPLPLVNLALGFKKLASVEAADSRLQDALRRVRQAMQTYPEMVSGEGRFDLDLARSFSDNVVCKIGAEAIEGIGFVDPPLGIAVKVHDGNFRAVGPIVVELLKQLGIVDRMSDFPFLQRHERPEVLNARKIVTGHVVPEFRLRRI